MTITSDWYADRAADLRGVGQGHTVASDTEIKFYGLWHLAGETVQATVGGLDCGDYTVASDGTVTVPFASDEQALFTPAFLAALDGSGDVHVSFYLDDVLTAVSVAAVIGKAYTSQGQTLRPALQQDLGLHVVNGLGKVRRSHTFAALLHFAVDITFGTDFDTLDRANLTGADGETAFPADQTYTGVYRGTLTDPYSYDSMLCWEVTRPVPAMVCAVSSFLVAEE